MVNRGSCCPRT